MKIDDSLKTNYIGTIGKLHVTLKNVILLAKKLHVILKKVSGGGNNSRLLSRCDDSGVFGTNLNFSMDLLKENPVHSICKNMPNTRTSSSN